jgi:hypothetical protein
MELWQALRGVEESEMLHKELQGENTRLVQSVQEERTRIAELANQNAVLAGWTAQAEPQQCDFFAQAQAGVEKLSADSRRGR